MGWVRRCIHEIRDLIVTCQRIGRMLYVVHIEFDGECIRIISARHAEPREEALYAQ